MVDSLLLLISDLGINKVLQSYWRLKTNFQQSISDLFGSLILMQAIGTVAGGSFLLGLFSASLYYFSPMDNQMVPWDIFGLMFAALFIISSMFLIRINNKVGKIEEPSEDSPSVQFAYEVEQIIKSAIKPKTESLEHKDKSIEKLESKVEELEDVILHMAKTIKLSEDLAQ